MAKKLWVQLLAVGIVGLLLGIVLGRQLQPAQPTDELDIYIGNADATDIESPFSITLPPDASQAVELEQLTTLISRFNFCQLPIEVVGIENDIATINLAEHPWNQDPNNPATFPGCSGMSWRSNYFQGSAGGMITSKTLTYTLLQPELQGDWIDGVTFQYQGEPIEEEDWQHISLSGVITRDNLP